jgi:membrane protein DedA with SNARE-associated domain
MTEFFIHFIETNLVPLGAVGVLIASLIEEVIAPIPSALVVATAGFFLLDTQQLPLIFFRDLLLIVTIPTALGVAFGSLLVFYIAYASGKPALTKWGKWLGLSWNDVEKIREKFSHTSKDEITLLIARTIPIIPSVAISAFCGLIRMNVFKYILITFVGTLVRAGILGFIGAQAGTLYYIYADSIKRFEDVVFLVVILAAVSFVVWGIYKTNLSRKKNNVLE